VLYAITIFLSAFLLFQIQPIIAKMILPWFGGAAGVWSVCLLFFQLALLLGYAYAHGLHQRLSAGKQAVVHTVLLAVSLACLPVVLDPRWKPANADNPSFRILGLLAATIGLPYFLLSTTSPLVQAWYARTHAGGLPYRLYALSNLGSVLALLSYPLLVEPNLSTKWQAWIWSAAYVAFVVVCGVAAWAARRGVSAATATIEATEPPPAWPTRALWLSLAACASVLLLSVTTFLTQDVAAVPFLWILPLSVYLLSFILCFDAPRLYWRNGYGPLMAIALAGMAYLAWPSGEKMRIVPTIAVFSAGLFACCMVCHGELARRKPHPQYLTGFYLMIALGGACGGLFVGLLAPHIFNAYYELPIGLGLCALLWVITLGGRWRWVWRVAAVAYLVFLGVVVRDYVSGYRVAVRNFYGQLRVEDEGDPQDQDAYRRLMHGRINHGLQMLHDPLRHQPVSYFCPNSGIGLAFRSLPEAPRRVGVLGLGCGTLAAYGRAGDSFRFYEINPLVPELAQSEFSYLRDTPAHTEIVLGDGRLSLEREPSQQFDLMVMDAFSGDSVPVHLITREAFRTYFRHLKPGGILAVNISNRYLNLGPVLERAAESLGKTALVFTYSPVFADSHCFGCDWVLLVDGPAQPALPAPLQSGAILQNAGNFRLWTDDYSNLYRVLK